MPYKLLYEYLPELAERETRTISVLQPTALGLPLGQYSFLEMFCDERRCDCRRVMWWVASTRQREPEAVIAWGWESRRFYARWLGEDAPEVLDALQGPCLNLGSPQSALAPALLRLCTEHLLGNPAYVERLKRHYRLFRARVEAPRQFMPARKSALAKPRRS